MDDVNVNNTNVQISGSQIIGNTVHVHPPPPNIPEPSVAAIAAEFKNELKEIVKTWHSTYFMPGSYQSRKLTDTTLDVTLKRKRNEVLMDEQIPDEKLIEQVTGTDENKKELTTELEQGQTSSAISDGDPSANPDHENPKNSKGSEFEDSDYEIEFESRQENSDLESDSSIKEEMTFNGMGEYIEEETQTKKKKYVSIIAKGGSGKTVGSKKLPLHWAEGNFLTEYIGVIRLEMRKVDTKKNVVDNMLSQYQGIATKFAEKKEELNKLFNDPPSQEKIMWILDGLDEVQSLIKTKDWLTENVTSFRHSPFIIFSRPEGKIMVREIANKIVEFTLNDLTKDQYEQYIQNCSFMEESKKQKLLDGCINNTAIKTTVKIPFYLATLCIIYNQRDSVTISDEIDIHQALAGMSLKAAKMKIIDNQMDGNNSMDKDKLLENTEEIIGISPQQFFTENSKLLSDLGEVLFKMNGNSVTYHPTVNKKIMKERLKKKGVGDDDIKVILHLNMFEERAVEDDKGTTSTVLEFLHRNVQEYIMSLFLCHNESPLKLEEQRSTKLKDTHLYIFRCVKALLLRSIRKHEIDATQFENRIVILLEQLINSCVYADPWRISLIICELFQASIAAPKTSNVIPSVVCKFLDLAKDSNPFKEIVGNYSDYVKEKCKHYMNLLASHHQKSCSMCQIPQQQKYRQCYQVPNSTDLTNNWPDDKSFVIQPLLIKTADFILFNTFPYGEGAHAELDSRPYHFKPPAVIYGDLPIPFVASDVPMNDVRPSKGFDVCFAAAIDDKILILFKNRNSHDRWECWSLDPSTDTFTREEMAGTLEYRGPSYDILAFGHAVVAGDALYYLDGGDSSNQVRLFARDRFEKRWNPIEVEGPKPRSRWGACAWSYKGDLFFYGGKLTTEPSASDLRGGETEEEEGNWSNEILRFTISARSWSFVVTSFPRPKKRYGATCAVLNDKVYVWGGFCEGDEFDGNIWVFDMPTSAWTEIEITNAPFSPYDVSLTTIDDRHLLLIVRRRSNDDRHLLLIQDRRTFIIEGRRRRTFIFDAINNKLHKTNRLMIEKIERKAENPIDYFQTVSFGKHVYVFDRDGYKVTTCSKIRVRP